MRRLGGLVICVSFLATFTGCTLNGLNGLINGSKIDLSELGLGEIDLNDLISEFTSSCTGGCG